jgi:molybdate transport system ATP-binding protein
MSVRLAVSLRAVCVRRGGRWVLQDINWELRPGERWALLGDNGAGKTQLLKLLSGDIWPTPTPTPTPTPGDGRFYRLGRRRIDLIDAKSRIAYVGGERQDKYARYGWNLRVRELVATGLHRTDLLLQPVTPPEARRVAATLRACGLHALAAREFLSLSYGEKRLSLLARALVQEPDWLLLDEFYNGLDADYRRRMDAVLDAARRRGQSWIATAHRAMDVPRGTASVLELAQGRIRSIRPLTRADTKRLRARAAEAARPERRLHQPRKRAAARNAVKDAVKKTARKATKKATKKAARKGALLLSLANVDLYVEYRPVLEDLNWQLRRGEHWAIFGANGAGKSSFLKLLYGDLAPALGGTIARTGFPRGTPIAEWKSQVGFVSPELQSTYGVDVSILELVASGRHSSIGLVDAATALDLAAARRWLKFFKLLGVARRRPRELSYGQLRRALIARAMTANARILLLDEPLTGLDPGQRALMKRLLQQLMRRQLTLIAAVHHAEDLPRGMTHSLHLHNRRAHPADSYSAT